MLSSHRRVNILKSCELGVSAPLSEVPAPELLPCTKEHTPVTVCNIYSVFLFPECVLFSINGLLYSPC